MTEVLQQIPPSQYPVRIFSAGDEIKQLLRAQRPIVNRRAIDYHSAALRHIKDRIWQKEGHNTPAIQADSLYASVVGIPSNFESSPVNGVTTKYIKMMHNKLKSPIFCAQWDPDGRRLVTGAASGEFTLWNAINFSFEALLQAHDAPIRSMKWSHAHDWLISSDDRGLVKYWQSNMNNVHTFQAHSDPVRCLSLSPHDNKMVTGSDDGTVRIWDFLTCHEEFILRGHGADVKCIDWHPSKALVVSGSKDNQQPVKLWDPKAGQGISTLHLHKGAVQDVKWNANGNWLLTASRDHLIKVLDIRAMKEMYVLRGHRRDVNTVAWHPVHECLFASGGSDGGIYFWIVGNTRDVGCMETAHDGFIWNLAWHPLGHVLCSASNDHTCKLWVRNKPGDEMIDKYNTSSHHGAGEISDIEIAGSSLPGVGYAKQQQNASITLPPPKIHQQSENNIPTTDSKDYGVRVENSAISVPVLGKDLVLTEKDLVNIANSISSTNRDISHNVAQELKPPFDAQPPPSNNPPFEPRRNFNHDVPWETNYPPRPMPPPHGEWNQPPPMGPPRGDFNRPPPKEWEGLPPEDEFRRFHGRPNEWIHPSRRPEGSWGFDHQRDRRWKGDPPGPPPEFRRDMFRGDREPSGMRDFPPDQPMDDRRMQEGFHRFDEHNRPIGGPPLRDPFRWERGNEPAWRGRDQFDAARGPRGPDGNQPQRPPFPDQQQQQQQQQQRNPDSDSGHRLRDGQPDPTAPPKNQDTLQDVNRAQPNLKEAPFQADHQASVQPFDPAKGPGPLPSHPPPADPSRVMRSQENQVPPNQLRGIDSPLQGGPPPNFHQQFDAGRNLEGNMPPPVSNQPFGHARDPRMQEALVNQHPFLDAHKQIPPNFPDGMPPNQFNRGDAPPQQGIPPGRPPEGPPLHQHHPVRGPRGQEPAWLQDPNKPPLQRIGSGMNDGTFPPNQQQQQFDPGNVFPPADGSMPPFDPNRNVPPFPNAMPPFRNQDQPGMGNQLPRSEAGPKLHPPEIIDGPKRPDQFVQKGLKQKDSTAPPWRDPKAAEQIIGNTFNDQAANQQFFRSLLPTPLQDGGNPMEEPAPDKFPPGHNPLNEPGPFDKGPPPFSQGSLFNDRAPGQNMDPRMRNARQEMGFDPRMDGPRMDQNFNPRMEAQQQQQIPPPGEIGGMGHPDPGRRHDFRMDGRPGMGQKFDPRMRPPGKEEPMHPPQEFLGGRDRDLAQDPPWHNSGLEQRLGPAHEFSDENFNDPKRRTLLPPPIMVHKDEESGGFHNSSGRQDEDNRRREQQRFDDYRGDKSWSNRPEYDRGRREPQREPRRSPTRRNSNDRPPAKRQRREKDMSKPSSRHGEGRGDNREKDRNSDKDRKADRNRDKTKSSEKPSVSNDKAKVSKS